MLLFVPSFKPLAREFLSLLKSRSNLEKVDFIKLFHYSDLTSGFRSPTSTTRKRSTTRSRRSRNEFVVALPRKSRNNLKRRDVKKKRNDWQGSDPEDSTPSKFLNRYRTWVIFYIKYLFVFVEHTKPKSPHEYKDTLCQFHQHFMREFFIGTSFWQLFLRTCN